MHACPPLIRYGRAKQQGMADGRSDMKGTAEVKDHRSKNRILLR